MLESVKMSKYNFMLYNQEGDLIVYNFLKGIPSLTKIKKCDIDIFNQLFVNEEIVCNELCQEYEKVIESLLKTGILIDADIKEDVLYDASCYEKIYENKLVLTILPTGKCNFNCAYCFESEQSFYKKTMSIEAQDAIVKFVQKQIKKMKSFQVCWFGGEPLMEPTIIKNLSEKFIEICNTNFVPYFAQITTNGYCLDAKMFDMLYDLKVYTYMVTIDGFKDQHDRLRVTHNGKGTYDKIMENLLRIRDDKHYKFARIIIRINITKSFLDVLDDFINYLDQLFSDDPRFSFIFVPAENYSKNEYSSKDIYINGSEVSMRLLENEVYAKKIRSNMLKLQLIQPGGGCVSSFKNSYTIIPNLKIYKCCAHCDIKENEIGEIDLNGNLLINESFHSRWYFVDRYVRDYSEKCKNCFYLPACSITGRSCPFNQFKDKKESFTCPLNSKQFMDALEDVILYATTKYPCNNITF